MKRAILIAMLSLGLISTQAHAGSSCEYNGAFGFALIMSVTMAPTGTTMMMNDSCRDEVLVLKESAARYQMTGEMDLDLQNSIAKTMAAQPGISQEQILTKLMNVQFVNN